jgi:prepilin-type processing-associated H-X9-DG protein
LLLGFRMSLPIISETRPAPGCTAFFHEMYAATPFFRVHWAGLLESCLYHGRVHCIRSTYFSSIFWWKGVNRGHDLRISRNPNRKRQSHSKSTRTKNIRNRHSKKVNFLFVDPLALPRVFWTRLGILSSPMWFFRHKSYHSKTKYWQKYKGAKFCWVLIWTLTSIECRSLLNLAILNLVVGLDLHVWGTCSYTGVP